MDTKVEDIYSIIKDYHCDEADGSPISTKSIIQWVNQFDTNDRDFILDELLHLLRQDIYVSKPKALELLTSFVQNLPSFLGYNDLSDCLKQTEFICVQNPHKSQCVLLELLDTIVLDKCGFSLNAYSDNAKKNYIYIDDILASGGTFCNDIHNYVKTQNLLDKIKSKEIKFLSYFFCEHTWGSNNARYILKNKFNGDSVFLEPKLFPIFSDYKIENNIRAVNDKLNLVYPTKSKSSYDDYLAIINSDRQAEKAYRVANQPSKESFFRSSENRLKLEQIFLDKGIEIISKIADEDTRSKHRPLGKTYPSYKTFGTGTMFFTWRNVSNTCPIVFWWNVPGHGWIGLFPLKNRGIKI